MIDIIAGPLYPDSSWVDGYAHGFNDGEMGLFIAFKGQLIFYPELDESYFFSLSRAKSKGEWVHDNVYGLAYEVVGDSL